MNRFTQNAQWRSQKTFYEFVNILCTEVDLGVASIISGVIRDYIDWGCECLFVTELKGEIKEYVHEKGIEFRLARGSIVEIDFIGRKECYGKEDYRNCRTGW